MQSFTESYSHGDSSWPIGASLENLESVSDGSGTSVYGYTADRVGEKVNVAAPTDITRSFSYLHDQGGRLVRKSGRAQSVELEGYSYNTLDQLTQARASGASTELLEYGPGGELLFRKVARATGASKATWYIGPNATVTADVASTCTDSASCGASALTTYPITVKAGVHVLLGGTRAATIRPPQPAATTSAYAEILYYHRDQQGSVVATSLRSGGVDGLAGAKFRYTPYGQLDKVSGVSAAPTRNWGTPEDCGSATCRARWRR